MSVSALSERLNTSAPCGYFITRYERYARFVLSDVPKARRLK